MMRKNEDIQSKLDAANKELWQLNTIVQQLRKDVSTTGKHLEVSRATNHALEDKINTMQDDIDNRQVRS
jgi:peptidoglycan hydrolase CwlO-like protein